MPSLTSCADGKRAELTAFFCLFRKAVGLAMVHVDNKGIFDRDGDMTDWDKNR